MVFEPDAITRLGELAVSLKLERALVVSDPGIVACGHTQRGIDSLQAAGIQTVLFDGVEENPTTDNIQAGLTVANEFQPDLLIGLGGGSSMDCAKGINFLYSCGGQMRDYWGVGKATAEMLPMIAVPTTSGTGSEMQSFALISDAQTHIKMACGDPRAACRIAILDPNLTMTQPTLVTALTGIDAVSHALETYVTSKRNAVSLSFSREAWKRLSEALPRVLKNPNDIEARGSMQLGAAFAGLAIENSMLGGGHALANPLTATYGIAHGQAVGLMLPHVIRFNGQQFGSWYDDLAKLADGSLNGAVNGSTSRSTDPVEQMADYISDVLALAGMKLKLSECGVQREKLPELAAAAVTQWTGTFNPRKMSEPELLSLYEQAF